MNLTCRQARTATLSAIFIVLMLPLATGTAYAHSPAAHYPAKWTGGTDLLPLYVGFALGNTPAISETFVVKGMEQWNNRNQSMRFDYDGQYLVNKTSSNCPFPGDNWVYQLALDGAENTLATTQICYNTTTGAMLSFTITFDGSETWFNGTGDAPTGQHDVWSVVAHELGHATGWFTHLDDNGANPMLCMDDSTQHTMCRFNYDGTERQRTLEPHDIDTFEFQY